MLLQYLLNHLILFLSFILSIKSLKIITNPTHQYSKLNENVEFKCKIEDYQNDRDIIEWCKNDFCTWGRSIETSDGRLKFKSLSKHYIIGDRANGEWNLLIENVTLTDQGQYKCSVTRHSEQLVSKLNSVYANLTIMEKPESFQLNIENSLEILLNNSQELICTIKKGKPEPKITWILIDSSIVDNQSRMGDILQNGVTLKIDDNNKNNYQVNYSLISNSTSYYHLNKLQLNGKMSLYNKTLLCIIEHPLLDEPFVKAVKLDLKYPPILSISYEPNEILEENKAYRFYCKTDSNSDNQIPSLFLYDQNMPENVYEYPTIDGSMSLKLNRSLNEFVIMCKNRNSIGESILNYTLNIKYPPKFILTPEPIIILNDSMNYLNLKCNVDSNPKAVIYWVKNRHDVIHIGEEIGFELNSNDNSVIGEYSCQARVPGFSTIASKFSIINEGLPSIYGDNVYYFIDDDKDLNIYFSVLSNPSYQFGPICTKINENSSLPLKIILPVRDQNKYALDVDDLNSQKMSTKFKFRIKEPTEDDVGFYNCTITNKYGSSNFNFEIKKKAESNNLWISLLLTIFFSILIFILILSIFVLICIQKKRNQKKNAKTALPNVSDHSGYDKNKNQLSILSGESLSFSNEFEIKQSQLQSQIYLSSDLKALSDDRKIDNSFKKQSNQISLILDQNSSENSSNQNLSYECLKFPSDTQNLILIENLKSMCSTQSIYSTNGNYQKANIFLSKFQTNV